jgi:hypothetical protein
MPKMKEAENHSEPVQPEVEVPDYTDGTWYVPAGKNCFVKKPVSSKKEEK